MSPIVAIHSYKSGVGRTTLAANLAYLLASRGRRVCAIDALLEYSCLHLFFGLTDEQIEKGRVLNDYLWRRCTLQETARDVTPNLGTPVLGRIYLVPSSHKPGERPRIVRAGLDVDGLNEDLHQLVTALNLDCLLIDANASVGEDSLLTLAMADMVFLVMRPDLQDFQGTSIMVDLARKLKTPHLLLVLNETPVGLDQLQLKTAVENIYGCQVAAVLPDLKAISQVGSAGIFCQLYPDHLITASFQHLADLIEAD